MFNKKLWIGAICAVVIVIPFQNCGKQFQTLTPPVDLESSIGNFASGSIVDKPGECNVWTTKLPNDSWENAVTFDSVIGKVIHSGGHSHNSYAQSAYTFIYDPAQSQITLSRNHRTGPRQCLQDGAFLTEVGRSAYVHGNTAHGSISPGGWKNSYKTLGLADPMGSPWLFDAKKEEWSYARPLGMAYDRRPHAPVTYDPSSDALVSLGVDTLYLYNSRTNRVFQRKLPAPLVGRFFYGIAADPVERKIVVFGGRDIKLSLQPQDYDAHVFNDTWIYDLVNDQWKELVGSARPPKGLPGIDFVKFSMIYEDVTGNILLRVIPLNSFSTDYEKYPTAETWAFNVAQEKWTRVELKNAPQFQGQMAYDSIRKRITIVSGNDNGINHRPSLGLSSYDCSVPLTGSVLSPRDPEKVNLSTSTNGAVNLTWMNKQNMIYDVWRAEAQPFPKAFQKIASVSAGQYTDISALPGKVYAYDIKASGIRTPFAPVYNQISRPHQVWTSVETAQRVRVRWEPSSNPDVVGYHLYRGLGPQVDSGVGTKITSLPITSTEYLDTSVNLSDMAAQFYWVTAVNKAGIESGASPWASTFPETVQTLSVSQLSSNQIQISWNWPQDRMISGFKVYYVNNHLNTINSTTDEMYAWYASWVPTQTTLIKGNSTIFTIPADQLNKQFYFYVRAVNNLGQEGFMSDIISATNPAFRQHGTPGP